MRLGTAKESRISRQAVKSGYAHEWGGWGRLSVDGPGQHNPDRSEGPWGRAAGLLKWWCSSAQLPRHRAGIHRFESGEHEGGMPTRWARQLGASLGRHRLTGQPCSRTGETPPYGILGEAMETSASFEARSAPLPYPTTGMKQRR